MSRISDLISQTVAPRVTSELGPHLKAFYGGIIRGYLPQVWWFSTESGTATLVVEKSGASHVSEGLLGEPDAMITWTDNAFQIALTTQRRNQLPAGTPEPQVQIRTRKGQAAFKQLRSRLGL